jgi:hypothetical protein
MWNWGNPLILVSTYPYTKTKVPSLAYDCWVTDFQRKLFKTRLALIAVALAVVGLAMGLHNLIR